MQLLVGGVVLRAGNASFDSLRGLGRTMPLTSLGITLAGLSLIGVPGTAGFISKWYLVSACIEKGRYEMAAIVLVGSMIALLYTWRVVETIYFGKRPENAPVVKEAPITMLVPMLLLAGGSIYFGIDASLTSRVATAAAHFLLGGAP